MVFKAKSVKKENCLDCFPCGCLPSPECDHATPQEHRCSAKLQSHPQAWRRRPLPATKEIGQNGSLLLTCPILMIVAVLRIKPIHHHWPRDERLGPRHDRENALDAPQRVRPGLPGLG